MKDFIVDDLTLETVKVLNAAIENPNNSLIEADGSANIEFRLGFFKGLNLEQEKVLIKTLLQIEIGYSDQQSPKIKGIFTIQFEFHVNELPQYAEKDSDNNLYLLNPSLSGAMLSITYSTARGIIYTRCLGTALGEVVTPIIATQKLIEIADQNYVDENVSEAPIIS